MKFYKINRPTLLSDICRMREQNEECKASFTENCTNLLKFRGNCQERGSNLFDLACASFATNHFCEISAERKLTLNAVVSWLVVCGRAMVEANDMQFTPHCWLLIITKAKYIFIWEVANDKREKVKMAID